MKNVVIEAASIQPTVTVGSPGLVVVPRNTTSLIASDGNYIKTEKKLSIPWYGYTNQEIPLKQDKNADKVAFKNTAGASCASYSPEDDRLAYYQCDNPANLLVYQTPTTDYWQSTVLAKTDFSNGQAKPYRGGVIGNTYTGSTEPATGNITFVTSAGKVSGYNSPDNIDMTDFRSAVLFTNTLDPTDSHFVIVTSNGDIFIGTPKGGKEVEYHRIAAPPDYNTDYNQTLCTLSTSTVYCYRGRTAYGESRQNFDYSKVTGSQIVSYSYTDTAENVTKVATNLFALKDFQVTAGGDIFGTYYTQLYQFTKNGSSYAPETLSQNANAIAASTSLYYIQDKGVYVVDGSDTTHQVFYSPNVTPKSLYATADKIFVICTTQDNDTTTYAYRLNDENDTSPGKRTIDILPTTLSGATTNDLVGNRLFVSLNVIYHRDTVPAIDPGEVAQKKEQALESLQALGVSIPESNIQFSY